jgi:hypothetical protein
MWFRRPARFQAQAVGIVLIINAKLRGLRKREIVAAPLSAVKHGKK